MTFFFSTFFLPYPDYYILAPLSIRLGGLFSDSLRLPLFVYVPIPEVAAGGLGG